MDGFLLTCFLETMGRLRNYRARIVFGNFETVEGKRDLKLEGKPDNHGRFIIHRGSRSLAYQSFL